VKTKAKRIKKPNSKIQFTVMVDREQMKKANEFRTQTWPEIMSKLLAIVTMEGGL